MIETENESRAESFRLEVDRNELIAAVGNIASLKRMSKSGRLKLSLVNGELLVSMPSVNIGVTAHGSWPSEVSVESSIVWKLAAFPPDTDPIIVTFANGRVKIGPSVAMATSHKS
jgi:hypothetical protein